MGRLASHGSKAELLDEKEMPKSSTLHHRCKMRLVVEPHPWLRLELFATSAAAILLELACIRWISANVRIVSYFSNLILVAAFLGLGLGLLSRMRDWRRMFAPTLLLLVLSVALFRRLEPVIPSNGVDVWSSYGLGYIRILAKHFPFQVVVLLFVVIVALLFVPLGQVIGRAFLRLPPLPAYAINLGGSIAGVVVFGVLGALWTGPVTWLACALALLVPALRERRALAASAALVAATLGIAAVEDQGAMWSPYQRITTRERPGGFDLFVNDDRHQFALDLSAPSDATAAIWRTIYDFPYRHASSLDRVLVVGSGTGNDVAAALRAGAVHIDAVEIDPGILRIGRDRHPERPYSDPRVSVHVDDARAYFRRNHEPYDLIVFGYLDSHALFSSSSNVRIDEYVYTREAFAEAFGLLTPNGSLAVIFCATKPWIREKLVGLMNVGGRGPPAVFVAHPDGVNTTVLWSGPVPISDSLGARLTETPTTEQLPSDDWPFLYVRERGIPTEYLPLLLGVLLFGTSGIVVVARWRMQWAFFALGAGFMLLEALSVTRLAILYGATWITMSLAVCAILLTSLVGVSWVHRRKSPGACTALALAVASVLVCIAVPPRFFLTWSLPARLMIGGVLTGAPVLFSGIAFARLLARSEEAAAALGANLMGATLGGVLECLSLAMGFRRLYLIVIGLYLAAAVAWVRSANSR